MGEERLFASGIPCPSLEHLFEPGRPCLKLPKVGEDHKGFGEDYEGFERNLRVSCSVIL